MKVKQFTFNHFQVNTFVLWDDLSGQCAIVDPAAEASYEDERMNTFIEGNGLKPVRILLTHAHVDHIAGLRQACERYKLPVTLHRDGVKLLRQAQIKQLRMHLTMKWLERYKGRQDTLTRLWKRLMNTPARDERAIRDAMNANGFRAVMHHVYQVAGPLQQGFHTHGKIQVVLREQQLHLSRPFHRKRRPVRP